MEKLRELIKFIETLDKIGNKDSVKKTVLKKFNLTQDRSVSYCDDFAIRFSYTSGNSFSNTVLSLSTLQKYDSLPFLVCVVAPHKENKIFLANTTFLSKISHSSQELSLSNIRGSFNGSDIIKIFEGIENNKNNIEELFAFHREIDFSENLARLVEATNNIAPTGRKFPINDNNKKIILDSVERAIKFNNSPDYKTLSDDLNKRMKRYSNAIMKASHIENVNIRGRSIEYLITEEDDLLKAQFIKEINKEYSELPRFRTRNLLGDYERKFNSTLTETDIKTKIIILNSNPKAYNIDKFLEFLSIPNSVFLFFFIGINNVQIANSQLISVFQKDLLQGTVCIAHWAGRNSRGVTQFMGRTINCLLESPNNDIDVENAKNFLSRLIEL